MTDQDTLYVGKLVSETYIHVQIRNWYVVTVVTFSVFVVKYYKNSKNF